MSIEHFCFLAFASLGVAGWVGAAVKRLMRGPYVRVGPGEELVASYPARLVVATEVAFASMGLPREDPLRHLFFTVLQHGKDGARLCFTDRGRMLIEIAWAHRAILERQGLWFEDCGPAVPFDGPERARRIRVSDPRGIAFELQIEVSAVDALRRWATC